MGQVEEIIENVTTATSVSDHSLGHVFNRTPPYRHLSVTGQTIVTTSYAVGVIGNLAALYIIHKEKKLKYKNKKHSLMLRCLVGNDLVALLGMLVQMYVQLYFPTEISGSHLSCVFRVIWRWFGLSSGCVAIVMAVERWLALTHPFFYQKNVTYNGILKAILILWTSAFMLVSMPFLGFGLYFDKKSKCCMRYRLATKPIDVAYAYVFFAFGLLLCFGISCANLSVTRYLCNSSRTHKGVPGHRISRSLKRQQSSMRVQCISASTPGEIAFARLMVALSISFLICWMPQLLSIPLAQFAPSSPKSIVFFRSADILMAIHFMLDPYIYVLLHHHFPCLKLTFEILPRHCCCSGGSVSYRSEEAHSDRFITSSR
ncbi:hypothetical protein RUM44_013171 [Polyplax serrata]|uniref:G-protein coupled receptors family 1 profile domain-containing protein n=1 Tax=Polyplax serrata TaxID=468196 RepID=A0ABR1BH33_POLSC